MGEKTKASPELMTLLRSAAESTDNEWLARKVAEWAANRIEALESSHAELLRVCELAVAKWFSGETSEINMELELRSAIHYAKKVTGEEKS